MVTLGSDNGAARSVGPKSTRRIANATNAMTSDHPDRKARLPYGNSLDRATALKWKGDVRRDLGDDLTRALAPPVRTAPALSAHSERA